MFKKLPLSSNIESKSYQTTVLKIKNANNWFHQLLQKLQLPVFRPTAARLKVSIEVSRICTQLYINKGSRILCRRWPVKLHCVFLVACNSWLLEPMLPSTIQSNRQKVQDYGSAPTCLAKLRFTHACPRFVLEFQPMRASPSKTATLPKKRKTDRSPTLPYSAVQYRTVPRYPGRSFSRIGQKKYQSAIEGL